MPTSPDKTWLGATYTEHDHHVRRAAKKAMHGYIDPKCEAIANNIRKCFKTGVIYREAFDCRITLEKASVWNDSNIRAVLLDRPKGTIPDFKHWVSLLRVIKPLDGPKGLRVMIKLREPSKTDVHIVNHVCRALNIRFFCWTHEDEIYAIWRPPETHQTMVAPIFYDLVFAGNNI